jgi:hypothetical protein
MTTINAKHVVFAFVFCGTVGGAIMSNIYTKVSITQSSYLKCRNYWEKAQKFKLHSMRQEYLSAKEDFFRCFTSEVNSLSKQKHSK